MKAKPAFLFLLAAVLLATVGGAWGWQHASAARTIALAALPAPPELGTAPKTLPEQIAAAEAQAHSRFRATTGLAKLSRLYHANGFLNEALRCYEGLAQLEPKEPRWLHLQATILAGYGEIEPAMTLWQQIIKLAPTFLPAQLRLGDCQLKANQPAAAAATYTAVLQRDPKNSYALLGLARLDYEAQRWVPAQERLETVVQQTNYDLGYDLIVTLYERTGQPERASAIRGTKKASGAFRDPPDPWLDDLMDVCYDPYRLALTAGFIARNGDPAKAAQLLERALELAPEDVSSHFQLGTLSVAQGNFPVAIEHLKRCTQLAPDFSDGWAQLSALQLQLGENSAAERTLAAGLAKCPTSPGLHLQRARNLKKIGANDEAMAEYRESIRLRPNEAEAYLDLAPLYFSLNEIDEGVRLLHQALEVEPANPQVLSILTYHAIMVGDETAVLQWFAKIRNQPRVPAEEVAKLRAAFQQQFGHPLR